MWIFNIMNTRIKIYGFLSWFETKYKKYYLTEKPKKK